MKHVLAVGVPSNTSVYISSLIGSVSGSSCMLDSHSLEISIGFKVSLEFFTRTLNRGERLTLRYNSFRRRTYIRNSNYAII
jgi:hypothetical protein